MADAKPISEFLKGFAWSAGLYAVLYGLDEWLSRYEAYLLFFIFTAIGFCVFTIGIVSYSVATFRGQPSRSLGRMLPAFAALTYMALMTGVTPQTIAKSKPRTGLDTIQPDDPIYIQAGRGSFNDAAFAALSTRQIALRKARVSFAGTPLDAMDKATRDDKKDSHFVFVAVRNNLIGLVMPTVAALQKYEITRVITGIRMDIEMCVLVPKAAAQTSQIARVASIQPALDQVKIWRQKHGVTTIEEPKGTAAAAEKLSKNEYPAHTGVIGPKRLADVYPNLKALECGIEDKPSTTEFALLEVRQRDKDIALEQARTDLDRAVREGRGGN